MVNGAVVLGLAGAAAQFVDGLLGMGYGVSASTLLITLGVAPAIVSATVHAAELPTAAVSGLAHLREGNVDRRIAGPLAAGGVFGAATGALVLANTAAAGVRPFVAVVLLALGVRMVACSVRGKSAARGGPLTPRRLAALGFVGGALDAFGGGGWGPTCTSVLMSGDDRETRKLIGSVNAAEIAVTATTVVALAAALGSRPFVLGNVLPLLAGGLVVAPLAARICSRVESRILGAGVGAALIGLNASILAGALGLEWLRPVLFTITGLAALGVSAAAARSWMGMTPETNR